MKIHRQNQEKKDIPSKENEEHSRPQRCGVIADGSLLVTGHTWDRIRRAGYEAVVRPQRVKLLTGNAMTQCPFLNPDSGKEKVFPKWRSEEKRAVAQDRLGGFFPGDRITDNASAITLSILYLLSYFILSTHYHPNLPMKELSKRKLWNY